MKLVLVVAGVVAALFAVGGLAQFFAASTDAAGAVRANLALVFASLAIGMLVLFCAAHAMLSRLDELLLDQSAEAPSPSVTVGANPYESLTRYYFANNEPVR